MGPGIFLEDGFLDRSTHEKLFVSLVEDVEWDTSMQFRQTASFGVPYNYSQMAYAVAPIPDSLRPVVEKLHARLGIEFNNCLLNYYPTGESRMGFHSDDVSVLVPGTGVAIVSIGSTRQITFRSKANKSDEYVYPLLPGSLLYMDDAIQEEWLHAIRKAEYSEGRVSLTWRCLKG